MHLLGTLEYLETIPPINSHEHICVCERFQFFRAFYIIVLGIYMYMYMLFVIQQNNIYCICSVFAYIFSDNEFVRFYRVR